MYYRRKEDLKRFRRNAAKQSTYYIQSGGYYFSKRKNRYQRIKYGKGKYKKFLKNKYNRDFRRKAKSLNTQFNPGGYKKYTEFWYELL